MGYEWPGISLPPGGRGEEPESLPEPPHPHVPKESIPVWARLTYPGRETTVKGFAVAWTREAVRVQYVRGSMAAYVWLAPENVKRRQLEKGR